MVIVTNFLLQANSFQTLVNACLPIVGYLRTIATIFRYPVGYFQPIGGVFRAIVTAFRPLGGAFRPLEGAFRRRKLLACKREHTPDAKASSAIYLNLNPTLNLLLE